MYGVNMVSQEIIEKKMGCYQTRQYLTSVMNSDDF